jgi:diguanylate cyclase (GGDEF)-like protein
MYRSLVAGLGALALLAGGDPLRAQTRPMAFERISLEQGLPQATVLSVLQDNHGYMWFGTEDGLSRYDGHRFSSYERDSSDPASLPDNMVWAIVEAPDGDLWVGTEGGGVARWLRGSDRFSRVTAPAGQPALSNRIRALALTPDGALWIGTRDAGLARLDTGTGELKRWRHDAAKPESLGHDGVYALLVDRSGRLWVGTEAGVDRFDVATGSFVHVLATPPSEPGSRRVRSLLEDRGGRVWVGTLGGGLFRLAPTAAAPVRYRHDPREPRSLSHDRVRALLEDAAGRLWVGSDGGLDLLDPALGSFRHYRSEPTDPRGLADDNVMSLYQDRGGVLWVGTRSAGVHRWNPATWSFGHVTKRAGDPKGLQETSITSFAEDRGGQIWIGSFGGGLYRLDRLSGELSRRSGVSPSERVMALASHPDGSLWIGTMDKGLGRLDPTTGTLSVHRHDPQDPASLGADGVMALAVDRLGDVWAGTHGGGLTRFDAAARRFERHVHDPANPESLGANVVTAVLEDREGAIWVGTDGGGLNKLDRESGRVTRFRHDPASPASLGSDTVFALHQDAEGRLWVGTRGAGLALLVPGGGSARFEHFGERQGLANDVVYGILPDGEGQLWLSTNNGLSRFDPRAGSFENHDASDGLQSNEFNFGAHYRSVNGELFFGGVNGFNAFFPQRLATNAHVPRVALTALLSANKPVATPRPLWGLEAVELGYRDDVVSFEFAALDYAAPEKNRYAYRLEGFDPDWIELGHVRRVTYTDLGPGNYRLRVRAANNDGVWNETGLSLPVRVEAPPWRRWWAYAAYVTTLGGLITWFVRGQRARLRREEQYSRRLEQEVSARTSELSSRNQELSDLNQKLVEASLTDPLTGLRNRRFLFEQVSKDAELVRRRYVALRDGDDSRVYDLSFVMIDLDHFKAINDACGHPAGDRVLRGVRELLAKNCRDSDVLIRWGGDEFLLVGRDNDPEQIGSLAERIRREIEAARFDIGEGRVASTTCSVGYACYPFVRAEPELYSWEEVLALADAALYTAKATRNAWVGYLSARQRPQVEPTGSARMDPARLLQDGALRTITSSDLTASEQVA